MRRALVLAALIAVVAPVRGQDRFSGVVTRVEAGDRVAVKLDGWTVTVRLHGIECPKDGPLAEIARDWTLRRVGSQRVAVTVRGTAAKGTVYGDLVPTALSSVPPLNAELTRNGLARWSSRYAPGRSDIAACEARAKATRVGVWGAASEISRLRAALPPVSATPAPVKPKSEAAKPTPTPAPVKSAPAKSKSAPAAIKSEAVGNKSVPAAGSPTTVPMLAAAAIGLFLSAEGVSRSGRRLRARPVLLGDQPTGLVKLRGIARPDGVLLRSVSGNLPALFLHERSEVFRGGAWRLVLEETNVVPFVLDDGSGQLGVTLPKSAFRPIRVARFYNDVPVERWHPNPYSGDTRTEIRFIPPDVTLVVFGPLRDGILSPTRTRVIEGDERRFTQGPLRLGLGLLLAAVGAGALALWLPLHR